MTLDDIAWREEFARAHPEWTFIYDRTTERHVAMRDDPNTIITDRDLGKLRERVEAETTARADT